MGRVFSEREIGDELRSSAPIPATTALSTTFPFLDLSHRRFEILAHSLLQAEAVGMEGRGWYDQVQLLCEGPDQARDILLYKGRSLVGIIQCKREKSPIRLSKAINELLKYCLYASMQNRTNLPIHYEFWAAGGFNNQAKDFFHDSEVSSSIIRKLTKKDVDRARLQSGSTVRLKDPRETERQARQVLDMAAGMHLSCVDPIDIANRLTAQKNLLSMFFRIPGNEAPGAPASSAQSASNDEVPIQRIAAVPAFAARPRPVNLLMSLGVDRRASIALTIGIDSNRLLSGLVATERRVRDCSLLGLESREWVIRNRPNWRACPGAGGLVWPVGDNLPTQLQIAETLAAAFREPRPACGDVVVFTLEPNAQRAAAELADQIIKLGGIRAAQAGEADVPLRIWSSQADPVTSRDHLLRRLLASLDMGVAADRNVDVERARRMRLAGTSTLDLLRETSSECLRLYDMSIFAASEADRPGEPDERHAMTIVSGANANRHLLHSIAFASVSAVFIEALSRAEPLTRAVAGLLTAQEMRSQRPVWPIHVADSFRPARAATYLEANQGAL